MSGEGAFISNAGAVIPSEPTTGAGDAPARSVTVERQPEPLASLAMRLWGLVNGGDSSCVGRTPMVPIHKRTLADICHHLDAQLNFELPPIPMVLTCPGCGERHFDEGEFATKPHHTHACQHCGIVWRPAIIPTMGVKFLPGFKNEAGV